MAWAQIFHMAGYPVHQEGLWAVYFRQLTPAELCGIPTLQRFDPHAISDLVRALL